MSDAASSDSDSSPARKNRRAKSFRVLFDDLPDEIRKLAQAKFKLFLENPGHPSLRLHELKDNDRGQHRKCSISVSLSSQYRAIYVVDGDTNVWYWIGTHAQYNHFTGKA